MSAAVRRALGLIDLDRRIQDSTGTQMNVERGVASAFYYVIQLLVLVAFFNALSLERVSGTLQALVDSGGSSTGWSSCSSCPPSSGRWRSRGCWIPCRAWSIRCW